MDKWFDAKNNKPKKINEFGERDYLICIEKGNGIPFVGWYDARLDCWFVAHPSSNHKKINVVFWREMVFIPDYVTTK